MRRFHYVFSLVFVFVIPTLIASYYLRDAVSLGELVPFVVLVTLVGSIWDVWATRHGRKDPVWLWQFNRSQTLGLHFFGLPFEEYLFYVASSVYVIYMWEGIKRMASTHDPTIYGVVLGLALWTFVTILIPYLLGPKGDTFIN